MIRLLIADDHAIVRAGLKQFIADQIDMEVVGEAATGNECISLVRAGEFDVVLLDISMPDKNGIDTLKAIKHAKPDLPVLMLSGFAEEQYAVNLLRAGASGFFPKAGEAKDLLEAIRMVASGRKYISPALAEVLALEAAGNAPEPPHRQLSNREFQIFVQLACGKTVTQIAGEVHLSVKTISTYRTRIMQKMNCSRNADLTAYALQHNLMG